MIWPRTPESIGREMTAISAAIEKEFCKKIYRNTHGREQRKEKLTAI
jgi:hypothetical protein